MFKPVQVKALQGYKLWVKFSDGVEGEVNLSHLVGKGVFSQWNDYEFFEQVQITSSGDIVWNDDLDVCPDALYMEITGQTPEQVFPNLDVSALNA
jgi:hypothetical protein